MKQNVFIILAGILGIISSCKKQFSIVNEQSLSSINVVNAAPDVPSLNPNFTNSYPPYYLYQNPVYYGSSFKYSIPASVVPVTIVSSTDTTGYLYSDKITLQPQGIYSLYILGGTSKGDVLFMQDTIPYYTDSTAGIRFINCLADQQPLTINLQGNDPLQTEFSSIVYKQITPFKPYDASVIGGSYTFEIRDPALPDPIATFTWNYKVGKNYTVVISGSQAAGINAFNVNNF
jgi:hypothetical protein